MLLPEPLENPVALPEVSADVQVNVVPATVPVSIIKVGVPEQILWIEGVANAVGVGLTITGVLDETWQPLASATEMV